MFIFEREAQLFLFAARNTITFIVKFYVRIFIFLVTYVIIPILKTVLALSFSPFLGLESAADYFVHFGMTVQDLCGLNEFICCCIDV